MSTEAEELARALAAAPWWPEAMLKHRTGMVITWKASIPMVVGRIWSCGGRSFAALAGTSVSDLGAKLHLCVPALDAPATQGCLWAMLREHGADGTIWTAPVMVPVDEDSLELQVHASAPGAIPGPVGIVLASQLLHLRGRS